MNKTFKAALAAVVALSTVQAARADLNIDGAVGLPLNPTAQIPNEGGVRLQGNYYDGDGGSYYGLFAAGRVADNIELSGGINRVDAAGGGDDTGGAIGVKYLFTRESDPAGVRFAVGAGYNDVLLKNINVYAVASKSLGKLTEGRTPIVGHLGIRYDRFDLGANNSSKASVFVGAEVPVTRTGEFQLVGEVGSENVSGGRVPYSISGRYRPQDQPFGVSAGYQRNSLLGNGNFFVQVGYTFDTSK